MAWSGETFIVASQASGQNRRRTWSQKTGPDWREYQTADQGIGAVAVHTAASVPSAPLAMFSFAAMSWWASEISPFAAGGLFRMSKSCKPNKTPAPA